MTTTNGNGNQSTSHRALNLSSKTKTHWASEIGLPCLDVLLDGVAPQPQAFLLPQPQGISSFSLFSLLYILVNGYGFLSQTLYLSLFYLKTERKQMRFSLSLFKTLFETFYLNAQSICSCLIFAPIFGFTRKHSAFTLSLY